MRNGGEEYEIIFSGEQKHIKGLEVSLYQQVFPDSTLLREKLELRSSGDEIIRLNKNEGRLHFKFPQYLLLGCEYPHCEAYATEIKLTSWELEPIAFKMNSEKVGYNHMFYPNVLKSTIDKNVEKTVKGPINIIYNGEISWLTAYEHASQDNLNGIVENDKGDNGKFQDMLQGTGGEFDFPKRNDDFKFIGVNYLQTKMNIGVSVDLLRGGYLEGEEIDAKHPYYTVWTATAFYAEDDLEIGKSIIRDYLFNQICEKPASRKPEFYYNTWGMQRDFGKRKGE